MVPARMWYTRKAVTAATMALIVASLRSSPSGDGAVRLGEPQRSQATNLMKSANVADRQSSPNFSQVLPVELQVVRIGANGVGRRAGHVMEGEKLVDRSDRCRR